MGAIEAETALLAFSALVLRTNRIFRRLGRIRGSRGSPAFQVGHVQGLKPKLLNGTLKTTVLCGFSCSRQSAGHVRRHPEISPATGPY
jgi:hypothetical protein